MSAVTLRSEPAAPAPPAHAAGVRGDGVARLGFAVRAGATRLVDLYQKDPLRVLFPRPARGDLPLAALVTTSGGLTGGDRLAARITVAEGAAALVTPQAAEKIYRSPGDDTRVELALDVAAGGWLEYLPQETILFDGARLRRRTRVDLAPGARLMAGEMLVFGRTARGERLTRGLVRDAWEVRVAGRLAWADALHLDGDLAALLEHPAGFDGALACATLVATETALRDRARELIDASAGTCRAGATVVNGLLVARWLGRDAAALRRAFGAVWAGLRHAAAGLPARLPRLWHV